MIDPILAVLSAVGFTAEGIAKGSAAAAIQASVCTVHVRIDPT